jgi:hypothetical protein
MSAAVCPLCGTADCSCALPLDDNAVREQASSPSAKFDSISIPITHPDGSTGTIVIGSITELPDCCQLGKGRVHWRPGATEEERIEWVEGVGDPEEPEDTSNDLQSGPCLLAISFVDEYSSDDPGYGI